VVVYIAKKHCSLHCKKAFAKKHCKKAFAGENVYRLSYRL